MTGGTPAVDLPDPSTIRSKGFTLRGAMAFLEHEFGEEGRERVFASLGPEVREVLGGTILSSSWYPFRLQVGLYEAMDRALGRGDLALCPRIGRFTAEHELSTIHRMTLKVASLSMWMRTAGMMWNQYYSTGRLRSDAFGPNSGTLRVEAFNPISKAFCLDLAGWFERTAELSGKNGAAVVHAQCLLDGHPACVYEARWTS